MPDRLLHLTTSLCRTCKNGVAARVVARGEEVWLLKRCATHGDEAHLVCPSLDWYQRTRAFRPKGPPAGEVRRTVDLGCPFDCGMCAQHNVSLAMPVVTITSACNLDCPICYVHNKNDGAFHMPLANFRSVLRHIKERKGGSIDLLNLTGGEPMLHPHFLDFLAMAREEGVHRVTICSNGLKLRDEGLVRKLGELGARIALSFDTFDAATDVAMQGVSLLPAKLRCLDLCQAHNVDVTLIPVVTRGYNDHEIGRILQLAVDRPNVRHVEVHAMTYTGQGGATFDRKGRISLYEVLQRIEDQLAWIGIDDFVPSPRAHPLCYQVAYLLVDPDGGPPIPFTRFLDRGTFYDCLADGLYMEPTPRLEAALRDAIDRLWVEGGEEAERILARLKRLLVEAFPADREHDQEATLRASEKWIKAIYVHHHMDEETFDTERLASCCDSNCYPDGSTIPVCAYNVLYREKEANFMAKPRQWNERSGGRFDVGESQ
jgi:hypothetical protein